MVLVDTSVWIDHLRTANAALVTLLADDLVRGHPWVIGEVALGSLADRCTVLDGLQGLPRATVATDDEVLALVAAERLFGRGIGWVDAQLLASARLDGDVLWSADKRLLACASDLGIAY